MTDTPELNVWRGACVAYGGASIEGAEFEPKAAAVIRSYGDQLHAEGRTEGHTEGYAQAVADVVAWLVEQYAGRLQSPVFLADEITRRFGKDRQ